MPYASPGQMVPVSTRLGRSANRRRAKVSNKFYRLGAFRRLTDQFVEPIGVSSDENPRSIGRVENNGRGLCHPT
jgi:hypothetical protein